VPKLVLLVSESVPELPPALAEEKGLTIRRVKKLTVPRKHADDLVAWLIDAPFVTTNATALRKTELPRGSVLSWNPKGDAPLPDPFPGDALFDEILSFRQPAAAQRTVRNLFRGLALARELAHKDQLLRAKESENSELLKVGIALSAERDNNKLLDYILRQVRQITCADAGTLYLLLGADPVTGEKKMLFKIAQNDSNPSAYTERVMALSKKTISGYVASTGTVLNIEDAYLIPPDREYGFDNSFDKLTGYRSKSMLTVPMQDHKGEILGVIQLLNRKTDAVRRLATPEDAEKFVVPFSKDLEPLVLSLASQAAVSLENNNLYQEIETLFEGFVNASVRAIESRDPTTQGHSRRVAVYTEELAKVVDRLTDGPYRAVKFTREQLKEIRYASLLHDFGKIGVREDVLIKAKKLYPDQLELVNRRFEYLERSVLLGVTKKRFALLSQEGEEAYAARRGELDEEERGRLEQLKLYHDTILRANEPTVLAADPSKLLDEIYGIPFKDDDGTKRSYLVEDEYRKLKIVRGTLDDSERLEIESHVTHTYQFLSTIPWTKEMKDIPRIAWGHHEKLDGHGYPRRIEAEAIPIQTRMMTVSDIYDALTASDRPYKPAVSTQKALDILYGYVKDNQLDPELVNIFSAQKIYDKK
jgi:HD-GYP domain-containing protein (c-di-GMP phosphodiesterase class II)